MKQKDQTVRLILKLFALANSSSLENYDIIYFQNENLKGWKSSKMKGWGKIIQSSNMGRIKTKLISLEKEDRSFKVDRFCPTTQYCPNCGSLHKHSLDKRIYHCDLCGYEEDRDVHAAKNVKLFGSTNRAECLEQASVERITSALKPSSKVSCLDEAKTRSLLL